MFERFKNISHKLLMPLLVICFVALIGLVVASRFTQKPVAQEKDPEVQALKVKTLKVGQEALTEQTVGTIKNLTSITLVAQTAGPVSKTYAVEGKYLKKGAWIAHQSTAYGTGSVLSVQRQLAQKNYTLADENLKITSDIVAKNRELADKNRDNTEELRKLSEQAIAGTRKSVDTNKLIIQKIETDLNTMSATASADTIQGLRVQLLTYQNVLNSSESQLRSLEYQVNRDNPPTKIAEITKDLVYKTTELQLKNAEIGKEISALNLKAAQINEGLSRVVAPFAGKVERVYVQPGQYLTPGTPIAKIKGDTKLCLVIEVSGALAARISEGQPLKFMIKDREYIFPITHISSTPTSGRLFEVLAVVPPEFEKLVQEEQTVDVKLPISSVTQVDGNRYLPLDAVFSTNTSQYVFVVENGVAKRQEVKTGEIVGDQIEITEGIKLGDEVILDRRVTEGQKVEVIATELGNTSS